MELLRASRPTDDTTAEAHHFDVDLADHDGRVGCGDGVRTRVRS